MNEFDYLMEKHLQTDDVEPKVEDMQKVLNSHVEQMKGLDELTKEFINSFDDDTGWLLLDASDDEKRQWISLNNQEKDR